MKLYVQPTKDVAAESHPARGAWIEIQISRCKCCPGPVAPRKGCVD